MKKIIKKIIATSAIIAFAAMLSSCEIKKRENEDMGKNIGEKMEISAEQMEENMKKIEKAIKMTESEIKKNNDKVIVLYKELEKTDAFKKFEKEVISLLPKGRAPNEDEKKKIEEIQIRINELKTDDIKKIEKEIEGLKMEVRKLNDAKLSGEPVEIMEGKIEMKGETKEEIKENMQSQINKIEDSEISSEINKKIDETIDSMDKKLLTEFNQKQEKIGKLFKELEKSTPKLKELRVEIESIFKSGKTPSETNMKRMQEIDKEIQALFTPEMKTLNNEVMALGNKLFGKLKIEESK